MPFGFNVFEWLMAKTMWDVRLGNTQFGGGFTGGNFVNSCWGNGFPQMNWGDSFNNTASSSLGSTTEERIENRIAQNKFNTLKGIINDYIKTLKENSEERITVEEKLKACGSYSLEHYEDLKDLYNEYKTQIQAKLKTGVVVSETTKKAAGDVVKALKSTSPNLKTVLKLDSANSTTAELADGIDAVGLLNSLQTTNKKSYKALYDSAKSGAKTELDKLTKALYSNLSKEAAKLKKETVLSEETKKVLADLSDVTADSATAENVDQMYYWVRKAKAEINNNKYENLQEDFPNDPLLGAANGVEATKKALEKEGLNAAEIEKATVKPDYGNMEPSEAVKSLVENKMLTKLTDAQFVGVKSDLPVGVKQAWYDTNSRNSYRVIRFIDSEGNFKSLYGKAVDANGNVISVGSNISIGDGLTPEKIEAVSKKLDEISVSGAFTERKASNGERVFEEKKVIKDRYFKRLFKVDSNGDLREWTNTRYDARTKSYKRIQSSLKCPLGEKTVSIDEIKSAEAAENVKGNNTVKKTVDPNAATYAQKLYNMDKTTREILVSKINKDNVVDILLEYKKVNRSNQGIYKKLCTASGGVTGVVNMKMNVLDRLPKALMRKACELGLQNSNEYQDMAKFFKVQGTPSYDSNGNINKIKDNYRFHNTAHGEIVAQYCSEKEIASIDKMINALLDVIVEKLN